MWIDESQTVRANLDHGRPSTTATLKEEEDPLGISDEGDRYMSLSKGRLWVGWDGFGVVECLCCDDHAHTDDLRALHFDL